MCGFTIKRIWCYGVTVIVVLLLAFGRNPVEGWAVLMEINDFPEGYSDIPVDFVDIERMQEMLVHHGWQKKCMLVKKDKITPETVKEGVEHLKNADENDIVLFYIGSHGGYIRHELQWNDTFPVLWNGIATEKKILLIDSCYSGAFLPESDTGISIASVSPEESGWAGIPEEGLPIVGFVFTYYFCESVKDVSVEEGFEKTVVQVRKYMKEVVYPDFKEMYTPETYFNLYEPHPVIIDQYPGDLYLKVGNTASGSVLLVLLGMVIVVKRSSSPDSG